MSKKTMALAAALLACGIGTALAQGQMQGQSQGQGQARTATPPYSQQVPDTVPMPSQVAKPELNPSAAGTLREGEGRASQGQANQGQANGDKNEHSGAVGTNANTHPLEALKARGKPRKEGMTEPSGVYPTPRSTMNRGSGQ